EVFWKDAPADVEPAILGGGWAPPALGRVPIIVLVALIVTLGLAAGPVFELARQAGAQLYEPARYVDTVLGGRP
ncbi:MAG TPA: hypothetical protein VFX76_16345, partial [Roseiflexaceae bacterium]|nr:hypothetical protein [Roseiflexaceae bacterium]